LVLALAGYLSKPIYVLNLGSLVNDNDLIEAVTTVPEHGIFLIEDIDAAVATAARTVKEETKFIHSSGLPMSKPQEETHCITLSGLLNAIDGTFSRDGRILIMTTNHPEKIDPALIRKGRADVREHIGLLGAPEVLAMCKHFLGASAGAEMAETVTVPIAPADLQELLLQKVA
jgi:chaperone BCS1